MNYKILIIIIVALISQFFCFKIGYDTGVHKTYKQAYENGLIVIERNNGKHFYRWIETHKLGYNYDE